MPRRKLALSACCLVIGLLAALALSACGGGGSSSSSSGSAETTAEEGGSTEAAAETGGSEEEGSESSLQAEATEKLQPFLKIPTKIWITEKLAKTPPTGKKVAVMDCGAPACTAWAEAVEEAAKALGWSAKRITQGVTPQEITKAWDQAARELPDAVFTIGIPKVLFSNQLKTLEEHEIPVLNSNVNETAGGGQVLVNQGKTHAEDEVGVAWAYWVLSEMGEDANVLVVQSPEFPITEAYAAGFEKTFKEACPSCETSKVEVSAAAVGSGENATKIVAALRSNPDVNYIVANDNIATGLPQALISAGLEVPIIGEVNGAAEIQELQEENPVFKASVAYPPFENGWQMVDWAARYFNGESTKPAEEEEPAFIVTPETVDPSAKNYYPYIPTWDKEFEALWGVG